MGPHCADVFDPRSWTSDTRAITLEVMRVVLAVGLFAIGAELPKSYMTTHVRSLLVLVVPTMAIGWIVVAGVYALPSLRTVFLYIFLPGFMLLLFPSLNLISCLVVAACLTPTDPVVSAAIISESSRILDPSRVDKD